MKVYPIFLNNLAGRRCVVVGCGHEGEHKVSGLLECDADVTLISEEATPALKAWAAEGTITWHARAYRPGDLKGAFLVIVAVTNPAATAPIWEEAQAEGILINALDDVPHCTFVQGSVVRRGPLLIAISTSGCAPTLSVRIRQRLESMFTTAHGTFVEMLGRLRPSMASEYPNFAERRQRWYELVDSDVLSLIEQDDLEGARERVRAIAGNRVAQDFEKHAIAAG